VNGLTFCSPFSIATLTPTQSGFSEKYEHADNEPQGRRHSFPMCRLLRFILPEPWNLSLR
jgi:hypothetical protein